MTPKLRIRIETEPLVRVPAELAVVGVFESERPLRGTAGLVDWRLCGLLSELVATGYVTGRSDEATLLASGGRLAAPAVLAVGLGAHGEWGPQAFEAATRAAFERVARLAFARIALSPLGIEAEALADHARAFLASALVGIGPGSLEVALRVPETQESRTRRELLLASPGEGVEIVAPEPLGRREEPATSPPPPGT